MRVLLIPILLILLLTGLYALAVLLRRERAKPGFRDPEVVESVRKAHGRDRCQRAVKLLEQVANSRDPQRIAGTFASLEHSLLRALPDCPADLRPRLIRALRTCAASSSSEEIAHRMSTLIASLEA
jgi:hypothetical protein